MGAMTMFNFEAAEIRIVQSADGEPLFVAKDVAIALGYADPTNAIKDHCRGVAKRHPILDALGRTQEVRVISEPDMLRLIVKSNLPSAERFERWVFEEVLPTIRKTGSYGAPAPVFEIPKTMPEALRLAAEALEGKAIAEQKVVALEVKVEADAPKVGFYDQVVAAPGAITLAETAKIIGTGRTRLIAWMRKEGWLRRNNEPYQEKIEAGLLDVKLGTWEHPDHGMQRSVTALVTGKGLAKLQPLWRAHTIRREATA